MEEPESIGEIYREVTFGVEEPDCMWIHHEGDCYFLSREGLFLVTLDDQGEVCYHQLDEKIQEEKLQAIKKQVESS